MHYAPPVHLVVPFAGASSSSRDDTHNKATHAELGRRIARLYNAGFIEADGEELRDVIATAKHGLLWLPNDVLLRKQADDLGITDEGQIFGGIVDQALIGTKIISHGLFTPNSRAPAGWVHDVARRLADTVLDGFSIFSCEDAKAAGRELLRKGPVRIKDVRASAGSGQFVVNDAAELDRVIAALPPDDLMAHGLVLEENLEDVITYSIGTVRLPGHSIAYWGTQRLTTDNRGEKVYGGSKLHCVRGGFSDLQSLELAPELMEIVDKAVRYDHILFGAYPGLIASRRNYDVLRGSDAQGKERSAVLEQSWRAGGASGAEILAFEIFAANPERATVDCATVEIYGDLCATSSDAVIYYSGIDPEIGPMCKYAIAV